MTKPENNTGALVVYINGEGLNNVSNTFFLGMESVGEQRYDFVLKDDLVQTIEFLKDFEILLKRPVTLSASIILWRDETTERKHRAEIQEAIYEHQFFWRLEKETRSREAITNFCAAWLQLHYSNLDFVYCRKIAEDEIALNLKEKQGYRSVQIHLVAEDRSFRLFSGNVTMETADYSRIDIIDLAQSDLLALRSKLTAFLDVTTPIHLLVKER